MILNLEIILLYSLLSYSLFYTVIHTKFQNDTINVDIAMDITAFTVNYDYAE